jgi:hypothetical protein
VVNGVGATEGNVALVKRVKRVTRSPFFFAGDLTRKQFGNAPALKINQNLCKMTE